MGSHENLEVRRKTNFRDSFVASECLFAGCVCVCVFTVHEEGTVRYNITFFVCKT